jgi:hypothetical protein
MGRLLGTVRPDAREKHAIPQSTGEDARMRIEQLQLIDSRGWVLRQPENLRDKAQLVLVFGETSVLKAGKPLDELKAMYPKAQVFGCSTAGEICGVEVADDTLVATAISFESSRVEIASESIHNIEESRSVGSRLAEGLRKEGLVHAFVLSDGLKVNGSALVDGLLKGLPPKVTITGGLSGDKGRFQETLVVCNGEPEGNRVGVLGLYGECLRVGCGSSGGWDPFGPERLVTRSQGNILYELDGKSSLTLYKSYLGEHAQGLPATGLLFPLSIRSAERPSRLVRTVLAVNEDDQSMVFAGDIPEGSYARLMKANINHLIDGATEAANMSRSGNGSSLPELAILISCVGRRMVLKQRVEEEVETVQDILGNQSAIAGFYSYGEMSPSSPGGLSELHNQTMTITTLAEKR